MARIRTIKPEFWTDEKIVELDPWDRLLFIGLWNFCDDEGYFMCQPKKIKMQVFPGDSTDVSRGLWNLLEASRLALYTSGEGIVGHVNNWDRHQKVSNPAKSRLKSLDLRKLTDSEAGKALGITDVQSPLEDSVRKGREGKGSKATTELHRPTTSSDAFETFWATYPRRDARRKAEGAFRAALKRADAATITAGAKRYAEDPNREAAFTAMPATWLNADRWGDGPLPARNGGIRGRPSTTDQRVGAGLALAAELDAEAKSQRPQIGA